MKRAFALAHAAFFLAGCVSPMLGPLLPSLQSRWGLGDAAGGTLIGVQFLAYVVAAAMISRLSSRRGCMALVSPGLLLIAAGTFGLSRCGWPMGVVWVACYGFGLGLTIPGGNLGLAALYPASSARKVMLLNVTWSIGAVLAPILIAFQPALFLPILAGCAATLGLMSMGLTSPTQSTFQSLKRPGRAEALLTCTLLFIYVGAENVVFGWTPTHALRMVAATPIAAVMPSVFWTAILTGRMSAARLVSRMSVPALVRLSLITAFAGAVCIVWAPSPGWLLAASVLCGLGLGPVFPLTIAQYAHRSGSGSAPGFLFIAAGIGGAVMPSLAGYISAGYTLRHGLSLVVLLILVLLGLQRRLRRTISVESA